MEHLYINQTSSKTVLVLHGMGGNKEDMVELVKMITPHHNAVLIDGADFSTGLRRYFKRSSTGLDLDDLQRVAKSMADELSTLSQQYGFDVTQVDAFGFSNGANMLLGMVLSSAFAFRKVVALRPSVVNLEAKKTLPTQVRLHVGEQDPYMSISEAKQFIAKFNQIPIEMSIYPGGHGITQADVEDAYRFLNV